jgi:hypothetical protein
MSVVWFVGLYAIGLICVIVGLLFVVQAVLQFLYRGVSGEVVRSLHIALRLLLTGSLCNFLGIIDAWTNPNEENFVRTVVGYAAFVLPVSIVLFVVSWVLRTQRQVLGAMLTALASLAVWATVGWAQATQLFGFIFAAFFWQ